MQRKPFRFILLGLLLKVTCPIPALAPPILKAEVVEAPIGIKVFGELSHKKKLPVALRVLGTENTVKPPAVTKTSRVFFYGKKPNKIPFKFIITIEDTDTSSPYLEVSQEEISQITGIPAANFLDEAEASILHESEMARLNKLQMQQEAAKVPVLEIKKHEKCDVALTFDDGPHPTLTPRLMSFLKKNNTPATFFVLSRMADKSPWIMKMMVDTRGADGKPLFFMANHTHSHPYLTNVKSDTKLEEEIKSLENNDFYKAALKQQENKKFFRCPYGSHNERVIEALVDAGYPAGHVGWDVDPQDWKFRNAEKVSNFVINEVTRFCANPAAREKGVIVLLHDIHGSSVDAAEVIVNRLKDKVNFVTIDKINPKNTEFKGLKKEAKHGN